MTVLITTSGEEIQRWVGYDDEDPGQSQIMRVVRSGKFNLIPYKTRTVIPRNSFSMKYYVNEVAFGGGQNFLRFEDETWEIGDKYIITPHGYLSIDDYIFVDQGSLVGIQFSVSGTMHLDELSCSDGNEGVVEIKTFAFMRQPHNVWMWVYAFDKSDSPIVNFCGHDDLDGLAHFVTKLKANSKSIW